MIKLRPKIPRTLEKEKLEHVGTTPEIVLEGKLATKGESITLVG